MAKNKSEIIRYNITDRGRKHIGKPRNFNVAQVVRLINGPQVQEMVNAGDMYGYLGHGVRAEWGMNPSETVLANDGKGQKYVAIEPAIRTIHITASQDGTIEHQAEFLDNELGRKAWEWYQAKIGGFSSVFTPTPEAPTQFYGFDYVMVPNFATNRGYEMVMDDVFDMDRLTSKQQMEWLKARDIERRVVMDSVRNRLGQIAGDLAIADIVVEQERLEKQQMASVLDNALWRLQDAEYRLRQFDVKPEPMLKLDISENNWLSQTNTQTVLDSLNEYVGNAQKTQVMLDNWSPIDDLIK